MKIELDIKKITANMILRVLCVLQIVFFFIPIWTSRGTAEIEKLSLFRWTWVPMELKQFLNNNYSTLLIIILPFLLCLLTFINKKEIKITYIYLSALSPLIFWVISDNILVSAVIQLNFLGGIFVTILTANVIVAMINIFLKKEVAEIKPDEPKPEDK